MPADFSFKRTPHLIFGSGKVHQLPDLLEVYGNTLLIITGGSSFTFGGVWPQLESELHRKGFILSLARVAGEPSPDDIDTICDEYRGQDIEAVVAIGGGSALDAGKAVSAMLAEKGSVTRFLEGVGNEKPSGSKLPFIAVPTTSGTGSEATSNAVLSSVGEDGFKKSLRHDNYIPNIALVDPELTLSCPEELTVACGMDTFTQLVEAYLSTNGSRLTDALALDGIRAVIHSLPEVCRNGDNLEARSDLSYASYLSGIVLANAGLGTVHGFASAIGGFFPMPHGLVCGTLMAAANRATLAELTRGSGHQASLAKYTVLGRMAGSGDTSDDIAQQSFIDYLQELTDTLGLPCLGEFGIKENDLGKIVNASSNKHNPVQFDQQQLKSILRERL